MDLNLSKQIFNMRAKTELRFLLFILLCHPTTLAVDVYLSDFKFPWDEGMKNMPCNIVGEAIFAQIEGKEVTIPRRDGDQPSTGNAPIEAWIGAYVTYQPEIEFSDNCYYVEDDGNLNNTKVSGDLLHLCFALCSNSSFLITNTECFCENDVNKHGNLNSYTDECPHDTCSNGDNTYPCGNTLTTFKRPTLYCMCLYKSREKSTRTWGFDSRAITQKECMKAIIKSNEPMAYSFVQCSSMLNLLCSKNETQNVDSTPKTFSPSLSSEPRNRSMETMSSSTTHLFDQTMAPLLSTKDDLDKKSNIPIYVGVGLESFVVILSLVLIVCFVHRRTKSRNKRPLNVNDRISYQTGSSNVGDGSTLISSQRETTPTMKEKKNANANVQDRFMNKAISSSRDRNADAVISTDATVYNFLHEEEKRPDEHYSTYDHVPNTRDDEYHTLGATNSGTDLQERQGVHQATYDHVSNTRDGEYHTLGATNSRNDPQELSDYDSMVADEYHTLDTSTTKQVPREFSDYDSMRREEYNTLEIGNAANVRHVDLSDYDTMDVKR